MKDKNLPWVGNYVRVMSKQDSYTGFNLVRMTLIDNGAPVVTVPSFYSNEIQFMGLPCAWAIQKLFSFYAAPLYVTTGRRIILFNLSNLVVNDYKASASLVIITVI